MILEGIRQKVFIDRYSLKDKDGTPTESTPEEMWRRVAKGVAGQEKTAANKKKWEEKFYTILEDFKFVPGGRILSGAGTGYQVTYFNCFVIPSPKDSREGILDSLKQLVEIQSRSGGVGLNLSSLRPRGARVKKVNGTSSGPVTWAGLFSYATHDVVQQGGTRRGATMLMLWDWHPDIEEFITVKEDLSKINGANLSVCVSDSFMEAVKADGDWQLVYPDLDDPMYDDKWDGDLETWKELGGKIKIHKTVKAREMWDLICTAAWKSAEPGLHFLERSNKQSNTHYFERLIATNPCLTADSWIHTDKGPQQIRELIGVPFTARVDGVNHPSTSKGFFKTATKEIVRLKTKEGYSLRLTHDHKVKKVSKLTRHSLKTEWVEAGSLVYGDKILLHDHKKNYEWKGMYTKDDGYFVGLLLGDGTLKKDKATLSVWSKKIKASDKTVNGPQAVMDYVVTATAGVAHRQDFAGWIPVAGRDENRLSLSYIKRLATELGMYEQGKVITNRMEKTSSEFYKGFLRGLFDADGSVQGTHDKGASIRLSQSSQECLEAVQRMLLRLGIVSTIYKNRRDAGKKLLPNGKGGSSLYSVKSQHELIISEANLTTFAAIIGFEDTEKAAKLHVVLSTYKRTLNRERYIARVENVVTDGVEDVYDAQVPGVNEFDANGLHVHNCGEQPLGGWAVCNLGAMNLAAYVKNEAFDFENFGKDVQVAMRLLDNVIDDTYYFFKENEKCAKDIRRTGLGIMGLADALIMMKMRYGSEEAMPTIEKIFQVLRDNAYNASSDIAKEKGAFPKFDKEKYMEGYHIKALPKKLREKIAAQGIRNAVLLTIAPTGTTSLLSGVSSGVEPVYEFTFIRRDRTGEHIMYHPLFEEWKKQNPEAEKPEYFVSANDLTPLEHVSVQAVAQKYIDSSISKTVNAPNAHTVDDVKTLYMMAYEMGLKGITYMRDGSREGVLSRVDDKKKEEEVKQQAQISPIRKRPMLLQGTTHETQTPLGNTFITINNDSQGAPFEIFINSGKSGSDVMAMSEALGRIMSMILRMQSPIEPRERVREIIGQLSGIGGGRSVGFGPNRVRSLPDAVAKVLAEHFEFRVNGHVADRSVPVIPVDAPATNGNGHSNVTTVSESPTVAPVLHAMQTPVTGVSKTANADLCPICGAAAFVHEEGCAKCYACGHAEC